MPIDYTNLRGGTYYYTMELKDSMGRGDKEVSVKIVKEKAFYEQVWFYILVGLAAALLITLLVHMYIQRKMRTLEAKHREEAKRERIENELQLATNIQTSILPHTFPAFPMRTEFDIYASMDPAKEVGGDFYDFFLIDDDHIGLVMADVSGKGVPAALFMMTARVLIKAHLQNRESPAKALENANDQLCEGNEAELFVNGVSHGRRRRGEYEYRLVWDDVRYEPGEVRVKTWRDGREWAEDIVKTALEPVRVGRAERRFGRLTFVTFALLDANGTVVPNADRELSFETRPGTRLVSLCNGDATSRKDFRGTAMRTFHGLLVAVVEGPSEGLALQGRE